MALKGTMLHVGAGNHDLPEWATPDKEVTLDINPNYDPDIVASMTDMGDIGEYDLVYSSHCLEHVYPHECQIALGEMLRVLVKGGTAIVFVPNLEGVEANGDVLYICQGGAEVCGLDMIYGYREFIQEDPGMAHRNGFTLDSLQAEFKQAGFHNITGTRLIDSLSIMVTGEKC